MVAPDRLVVHFSSESAEWYTPKAVIARVLSVLGEIDLDPCSNSHINPNVPAKRHYTKEDDGLAQPWSGRVYLNPPYSREVIHWIRRLVWHYRQDLVTEAIALVAARPGSMWWALLRDYPICLVSGRLRFSDSGPAPFPSAIVYLGANVERFAGVFGDLGDVWIRYNPKETVL